MNDMQAFQQRTNEARAAIGKPPVVWPPLIPYRLIRRSTIGMRFFDAQEHDIAAKICLQEIAELANEARQ